MRRLPTRTLWKPFATAVLGSIDRAQNYIYAENPYLFDRSVVAGLVRARMQGVDVRVVLPRVNDFKAGGRSNLIMANYLLENGVRVYFYPGMTHVKALLVDDWACVGSGNLNHLSLRISQEENIATSDPRFAAQLKSQLFEADFARSYELKEPISVNWQDVLADLVMENF
jgi:phosphatidylserine/phosphatidylglycerophosphate/cardiolipin synthase-like enzyme